MINFFKNGLMPYNRTTATVSLCGCLTFVVLYVVFTDFFLNASILIALLFPLAVVSYYMVRLIDESITILAG